MVFRYRNLPGSLDQFRDEMDRLVSGLLSAVPDGGRLWRGQPAINLWETEEALMAEIEVPGVKNDQIDISVIGEQLTLKVEVPDESAEGVLYHRRERPVGSFSRVIPLPHGVDAEQVQAELHDGVLTITMPKTEAAKPRKISVKAN